MHASAVADAARQSLGPVGAYLPVPFTSAPPADLQREAAGRLERAGYRTAWVNETVGGKDPLVQLALLLPATERMTFGTGIGSALFRAGVLVPNTEFGHIEIRGRDAEKRASERAKELHDLSWGKWAGRVDEYLGHMEALTAPDLIIIGGGISRKADKFLPLLTSLRATVVPAAMHNDAGIVGAALSAGLGAPVG